MHKDASGIVMDVLIFGTGRIYQRYKKYLSYVNVRAFLDNSVAKHNTVIDGIAVYSPELLDKFKYDYIVIMCAAVDEIKGQLKALSIEENKILLYKDLGKLCALSGYIEETPDVIRDFINHSRNKKVLLFSHDMGLAGAPVVLLYFAKILKKHFYDVVVYTGIHGALEEQFLAVDIPVVIDDDLFCLEKSFNTMKWVEQFDLVVVNTVVLAYLLADMKFNVPVLWWIHEEKGEYYTPEVVSSLQCCNAENIHVYAVSPAAARNFAELGHKDFLPQLLMYGIPDAVEYHHNADNGEVFTFCIVGDVIERKNQLLAVQAVHLLNNSSDITREMRLDIIGDYSSPYGQMVYDYAKDISNVRFLGRITHEEVIEFYANIDALLCPSSVDPMPVVVTEALMLKKLVIISKAIGQSAFLIDGESCLMLDEFDAECLADKMKAAISAGNLDQYGQAGRKIYDAYFSLEKFEKNILEVVKNKL